MQRVSFTYKQPATSKQPASSGSKRQQAAASGCKRLHGIGILSRSCR
jgi:hypothetical protein